MDQASPLKGGDSHAQIILSIAPDPHSVFAFASSGFAGHDRGWAYAGLPLLHHIFTHKFWLFFNAVELYEMPGGHDGASALSPA